LPLLFVFASVYAKLNGETNNILLFITPRFAIILFIILPVAFIGFADMKKAYFGTLTGIILYIFFDQIHGFFGIKLENLPYDSHFYKMFIFALSAIMVIIVFLIIFLQKINIFYEKMVTQQKSEIENQRDEILAQSNELKNQRDITEEQNRNIKSSIQYASRIQNALLPSQEIFNKIFPNHFIFYKPRDIVSGDFYYIKELDNQRVIFAAADCTGHGVPGAFMSMLGMTLLNDILANSQTFSPNEILNELRKGIKNSLQQTGKIDEAKDGMDIALCLFDSKNFSLQFSGAHNPLYLIRNNELIDIKGDKMPVGVHPKDNNLFTNHEISLEKNDKIYIFSDGYVSQFGGERKETFKTKYFQALLLKICNEPILKQREILENSFLEWKRNLEQVDDILVIGISF